MLRIVAIAQRCDIDIDIDIDTDIDTDTGRVARAGGRIRHNPVKRLYSLGRR